MEDITLSNRDYSEEMKQAYTRIIFLVIALIIFLFFKYYLDKNLTSLKNIITLFMIGSILHLSILLKFPTKFLIYRKIVVIFMDMIATTAFIYYLEFFGIIFSPLYLWIIIGNGLRFGTKYLFISMSITLFSLITLLVYSLYWRYHFTTILGLGFAIIILPLSYAKLLKRLQHKHDQLESLLKLTEHQSRQDGLTNLPNRKFFEKALSETIEKKIKFSLFFVDLDGFKKVNDELGHHIGDNVLQETAYRLQTIISCNSNNIVARLGGDEFVIIAEMEATDIHLLAKQIITELSKPYCCDKRDIAFISASIGISYYPEDTEDEFLLKKYADMAMYQVKANGKNSFMEYRNIV